MEEKWKRLIYNNEDFGDFYLVSNQGRIKNARNGYIRKFNIGKNGYCYLCLTLGNKDNVKTIKIHRAVACTFIPNPNNLPQVNHKDGNKENNFVDNLEWVTAKQNGIHAIINNLHKSGNDSALAKLNIDQVKFIKENCIPYDKDFGCVAMANRFNVNQRTISNIIHNNSWKNYSNDYELIPYENNKLIFKREVHKCKMCGKEFETMDKDQIYCSHECCSLSQRKVERPSKNELLELIKTTSFLQIGKLYGVSDNAIRKWCKYYELPYRKKDIKHLKTN